VTVTELLDSVKRIGGVLEVDGDKLKCQLPKDAVYLAELLREHKQELIGIVNAHGGRLATFPHCPRCASYALYRRNNIGTFECQTCGLRDVDEAVARRTH